MPMRLLVGARGEVRLSLLSVRGPGMSAVCEMPNVSGVYKTEKSAEVSTKQRLDHVLDLWLVLLLSEAAIGELVC